MDIVGPLPTIENGHSYKLIIQDLLTKYSVAIRLKQAKSSEIAKALVKKFINLYTRISRAECLDNRSVPEFHKQHDASRNTQV